MVSLPYYVCRNRLSSVAHSESSWIFFNLCESQIADDTQLYMHTTIRDVQLAKRDMITAIMDINAWSHSHRLKLNAQKSEIIWLGTR